jgi:SAM-dependent methyltransferase
VSDQDEYLLSNRQAEAGERFLALGSLFDPTTKDYAREIGITSGWHVWEVGAGGPSLPEWFAEQVGLMGRVLATDIDTSWLVGTPRAFEVLQHDVSSDQPPTGEFDLVHARLVLVHLRQRDHAMASMISALRPGGWLFLEEADPGLQPLACPDARTPAPTLANKLKDDFRTLMVERGVDLAFGRTLPGRMRAAGLEHVRASGFFPLGGPVCDRLERATVEQIRTQLVTRGLATDAEIEAHLANIAAGTLTLTTSPMISAIGRLPDRAPNRG